MRLKHRIRLSGAYLDALDDRVLVTGYEELAPNVTVSAVSMAGGGQRLTANRREYLEINVRFAIRVKPSALAERGEVLQLVNQWFSQRTPGWLRLNTHSNQRVYVTLVRLPAAGDMFEWTNEYTVTLRAVEVPYFSDADKTTLLTASAKKQVSKTVTVPGSAPTVADVSFKINSGTMSKITITADQSTFVLSGLGMTAGETLLIQHNDTGRLLIRILNTSGSYRSVLSLRTPESSDDLVIRAGSRTISVTAATAGTLEVSCFGRYA